MFLRVALEALEPLDEVFFLVVWQSLDNIDHKDSIATVAESWAQVQPLVLRVMDDLWLGPSVDIVVE